MAEAIAEGAREHMPAVLLNAGTADMDEMRLAAESSTGVLIGSCTINNDALEPIWRLLSLLAFINRKGKTAGAFGSYGWSGEAVGLIEERLRGLRVKVSDTGPKVNFVPTEDDLASCRAYGEQFARSLIGR
jgi:flavorubredoxin